MNKGYNALYNLQDEALNLVFSEPYGLYLTGGTALSRFYLQHRYSDDLDFFTNDVNVFSDIFRLIQEKISTQWTQVRFDVDARDFKRLRIETEKASLKLDFVADRTPRIGLPIQIGTYTIDTVRNILSNKICAVIGRDEGRDVADIIQISRRRRFSWADIVTESLRKDRFSLDDLLYRLRAVPSEILEDVPYIDTFDVEASLRDIEKITMDIEKMSINSIARDDSPNL
ncbi:MAG: nucleotidyl transferase AbiEii/AbiGii toxin family protein [Treponemataceae bacterium]